MRVSSSSGLVGIAQSTFVHANDVQCCRDWAKGPSVSQTPGEIEELIKRYSASIKRLKRVLALALGAAVLLAGLSMVLNGAAQLLEAMTGILVLVIIGALLLIGILTWSRAQAVRAAKHP